MPNEDEVMMSAAELAMISQGDEWVAGIRRYFDTLDEIGATPLMRRGLEIERLMRQAEIWVDYKGRSHHLVATDLDYLRAVRRFLERHAKGLYDATGWADLA